MAATSMPQKSEQYFESGATGFRHVGRAQRDFQVVIVPVVAVAQSQSRVCLTSRKRLTIVTVRADELIDELDFVVRNFDTVEMVPIFASVSDTSQMQALVRIDPRFAHLSQAIMIRCKPM